MLSVLRLLLVILCLFVTTTIAIKGTLPIASRRLACTFAMASMHEYDYSALLRQGASAQEKQLPQDEGVDSRATTNDEEAVSSNISLQLAHGIAVAHSNLVETWKVWFCVSSSKSNEVV